MHREPVSMNLGGQTKSGVHTLSDCSDSHIEEQYEETDRADFTPDTLRKFASTPPVGAQKCCRLPAVPDANAHSRLYDLTNEIKCGATTGNSCQKGSQTVESSYWCNDSVCVLTLIQLLH